jgi:DNA polymerase elongation subunit (family B)
MKRLFFDIETSPNIMFSWRCGGKIFLDSANIIQERAIICICYKWEHDKKIHSLTWECGDDRKMLEEFAKVVSEADEMVAHNGDNFDLRWFNARSLIHGLPPIPQTKTVDTLKIALKHFYLNSNRLDYLGKILFGEGKIKTEFDLWKRIVLLNDESALREMVRYCKQDVVLLERVWERLRDYDTPKTHAAVLASGNRNDRWMCPHCGSDSVKKGKTRATAKGFVQHQMVCRNCGRYYSVMDQVFSLYLKAKFGSNAEYPAD